MMKEQEFVTNFHNMNKLNCYVNAYIQFYYNKKINPDTGLISFKFDSLDVESKIYEL